MAELLLKHNADIEAKDVYSLGARGGRAGLFGHGAVDSQGCVCGAVWLDFLGTKLGGVSSAEMVRNSESVQRNWLFAKRNRLFGTSPKAIYVSRCELIP